MSRLFLSFTGYEFLPENYLRSITSIKSFQFPSSRSIITTSLIIMSILQNHHHQKKNI
ncbi:hypothetical protein HMPREF3212_03708 [Citrobacter freundii]|nr:hypothetical protein HMPREF3212_03708 [Citrobacter freundii]